MANMQNNELNKCLLLQAIECQDDLLGNFAEATDN